MATDENLEIWFVGAAGGTEALDQVQLGLRDELSEIPGLRIEPIAAGPAPPGSKAIDVHEAALLLPAVVPAVKLLTSVIGVLRDWMFRQPAATTIKVKIGESEVEWTGGGAVPEPVERFLEAAVKRHAH